MPEMKLRTDVANPKKSLAINVYLLFAVELF